MAKFRLIKGTHGEGSGASRRVYNHADPGNNVVETDLNLAALMPGKFERVQEYDPDPYRANPQANRPTPPAEAAPPEPAEPAAAAPKSHGHVGRAHAPAERLAQYGDLDRLSVQELREVAEAEGIALPKSAHKKEDLLHALRGAK